MNILLWRETRETFKLKFAHSDINFLIQIRESRTRTRTRTKLSLPGVVRGVHGGQAALAPFRLHSVSELLCVCVCVCPSRAEPSRAGGQRRVSERSWAGVWPRERARCGLGSRQTPPPSHTPPSHARGVKPATHQTRRVRCRPTK